ncbi:MAG: hypothetical protein WDN31_07160 [Hyphomicrobium sp.]
MTSGSTGKETASRVRRGDAAPQFVIDELIRRKTYARRMVVAAGGTEAILRYRTSLEDFDQAFPIRHRRYFAWMEVAGERVGALELDEYTGGMTLAGGDFFAALDCQSQIQGDLALVLLTAWSDVGTELLKYGQLCSFEMRGRTRSFVRAASGRLLSKR